MTNQIIGLIGARKVLPHISPLSLSMNKRTTVWRRYHQNHMPPLFLLWLVVMWLEPKQNIVKQSFRMGSKSHLLNNLNFHYIIVNIYYNCLYEYF